MSGEVGLKRTMGHSTNGMLETEGITNTKLKLSTIDAQTRYITFTTGGSFKR